MTSFVVIGSLVMFGLVVVVSWAVVGIALFAAWFLVVSAGLILKLIVALLIVGGLGLWRQSRLRPQPRSIDTN